MKLSENIVTIKTNKNFILFSTLSKAIIELNKTYYEALKKCDFNNIDISQKEMDFLINNFFLIDTEAKENDIMDYLIDSDRINQKVFSSYIAFSTLCNFKCIYCYEEGQSERKNIMDKDTLYKTIEWYKSILKHNNYKKCKVTLFGGEPLLHKDLITLFVSKLKEFTDNNNIELYFDIITNGYLLDKEIINFLDKYGLKEIQITIDGIDEVHDKRRPLRNGEGSFDKIIKNIMHAPKFNGCFVIRVSFDNDNIEDIKKLLSYLKNLDINNEFLIYLAPIHQTTSQNCNLCSFCTENVYENVNEIINIYKELYYHMYKIGLKIPKIYKNGPCMALSKDTVLIDSYGDLYKCVEMISIKKFIIGNVKNDSYNQRFYNFVTNPPFKKCIKKKCKYVTLCGGGCSMQSYLKYGTIKEVQCEYPFFEKLIPFLLEMNYGNK